jgi:subfamily B ATP-binding cassette protein MsbA
MNTALRRSVTDNNGHATVDSKRFAQINKAYLRFLSRYARPYSTVIIQAVVVTLAMASLRVVLPFAFNKVTKLLMENDAMGRIIMWMGIGLGSVTLYSGVEIIGKYLLTLLHVRLTNDMRNDLYDHIQNSPLQFHLQRQAGEITGLVSNDVNAAASGVIELFNAFIMNPTSIVFLAGTMIYFNPLLSIAAIASVPLVGFFITRAGKKARKAEFGYLEEESRMLGSMVESLVNVKQVKSFGLEKQQQDKVRRLGEKLVELRKKAVLMKAAVSPAAEILNVLALLLMALIAYYQLKSGHTTQSDIVGCLTAAFAVKSPVKTLSNALVAVQRSVAGWQRIDWIFGGARENGGQRKAPEVPVQQITLRDLSFSYDGRAAILADVHLTVHRGERLAVFGRSGAGKTTLVDLIIGFYPASSGKIFIGEDDISQIDVEQWRNQIGIVTQEPFLFNGSIEDNIRHGYADADPEQIRKAARLAGCEEIVHRLPGGLAASVGERGIRLSGGERKRVALARAIVRPISVLLLDEATSELDSAIENDILSAIDELSRDLIVLHVSHRPAILNHCDRAVILEGGTVRELTREVWPKFLNNESPVA